jgi:alpha-glucosidase (family GH31 glycosyl hydrolase)
MGFPIWGSDTGGYYEFKDREVFARSIECSTFSGLMEIGGIGKYAPWDMPTDPGFDPEDRELRDRWDQYMFGPDLMVAPVWRVSERSREVYFPKDTWRSYWDPAEVYTGKRTVTVPVPLDHIPV